MPTGQIQSPLKSMDRFKSPLLSPASFSVLGKKHRLKCCVDNHQAACHVWTATDKCIIKETNNKQNHTHTNIPNLQTKLQHKTKHQPPQKNQKNQANNKNLKTTNQLTNQTKKPHQNPTQTKNLQTPTTKRPHNLNMNNKTQRETSSCFC